MKSILKLTSEAEGLLNKLSAPFFSISLSALFTQVISTEVDFVSILGFFGAAIFFTSGIANLPTSQAIRKFLWLQGSHNSRAKLSSTLYAMTVLNSTASLFLLIVALAIVNLISPSSNLLGTFNFLLCVFAVHSFVLAGLWNSQISATAIGASLYAMVFFLAAAFASLFLVNNYQPEQYLLFSFSAALSMFIGCSLWCGFRAQRLSSW